MKKKFLAVAIAAAAAMFSTGASAEIGSDPAPGMQIHINGNQLYLSGDVGWLDGYALQNILDRLAAQGIHIDTLVMRDSRGGALNAGYDIGSIARNLGLKTIVSGYCISACSTMFVGGVDRAFAGDQPLWRQYIGIHGASINGQVADDATQQGIYQWFLYMIAGGDPSRTDDNLLQNAFLHMQDSQALAYIYDPAAGADPSVYWCNSGSQAYADCLKYPQDDAYSLGMVTEQGHALTNDTLNVTSTVSGNINPNYYNPWDPDNGSYVSTSPTPGMPGYVDIFFNDKAFSLEDSYGVLRLTGNGHWTLGTDGKGNPIRAAADSMWLSDGGRLTLDGGIVNIKDNYITDGGVVEGSGQFGQLDEWTYLMARSGGLIHPTGQGIDLTGEVVLYNGSTLSMDVHPGQTDTPALQIGLYYSEAEQDLEMGALLAYPQASLALNVAPGFYKPGDDYALVGLNPETAYLRDIGALPADFFGFLYGGFYQMERAGADGHAAGDGYLIDPTTTSFQPFADSLLSFNLIQQGDGVWLQVNNPFSDAALCDGNDCTLGNRLSGLAQSGDSRWQPMLAAMEFATRTQARDAVGTLRGDAYGTWRTARYHLVNDFGQALDQHLLAADPVAEQGAGMAMASATGGMGGAGHNINVPGLMRYLASTDDGTGAANPSSDLVVWGRVFGRHHGQSGEQLQAGMNDDSQGLMLGLDRRLDNGLVFGGALGYGSQTAKASDASFRGETKAVDGRIYLQSNSASGYVNATLAYTSLRNDATRTLALPLYAAQARSHFNEHVVSFDLEHAWTLTSDNGTVWQPILPRIDMAWLPGTATSESGSPAIDLNVQSKDLFTASIGAGVQAFRSFHTAKGMTITPHGRIMLEHRYDAKEQRMFMSFAGDQGSFLVTGPGEGKDHLKTVLGVTARSGDKLSLMADFVGDYTSTTHDQGVMLGARYRW